MTEYKSLPHQKNSGHMGLWEQCSSLKVRKQFQKRKKKKSKKPEKSKNGKKGRHVNYV